MQAASGARQQLTRATAASQQQEQHTSSSSSKPAAPSSAPSSSSTTSKEEATAGSSGTSSSADGEESDDQFENMLLTLDPVTVTVTESIISGLVIMVVAGVLGSWLGVDPWSYYKADGSAALLAAQASVPLVLGMAALACVPTGTLPEPNARQRQLLSTAEDDVIAWMPAIDLGPLLFPALSEAAAVTQQQQQQQQQLAQLQALQQQQQQGGDGALGVVAAAATAATGEDAASLPAATTRPVPSGLRLFQLWVTKPWCPEFSAPQLAAITASSGLQLAASELLTRGLVVALLAGWLREAVASADQSSVLFWNKLFKLTSEGSYRWFGTWVVAAFSMVAVFREAGRMQRWARLVLFRLAQRQRKQQGKTDAPAATAPAATAAATVGVAAAAAAGPLAAVEGNGVGKGQPAAASKEHKEAEDEEEEEEEDIGPLEGLAFTDVQRPLNSINIARTLDGYSVELRAAEENLAPTREDGLVWSLAMLIGTAQVVQLALLYGSTGTLLAPLTARLVLEGTGNVLIRTFARGGAPSLASMTVVAGSGSPSSSKTPP